MNETINVGVIGTGLMGLPMAERLAPSTSRQWLSIFNRTATKMELLRQSNVELATSSNDILTQCQVLIVICCNREPQCFNRNSTTDNFQPLTPSVHDLASHH
jgi:3-hydroxyisobutyrate dehydrogenase-like beta-hydroxyacid dehydrogenase